MAKHNEAHVHVHDVVHADEHRPNVKLYLGVFAALMLLTGLTVFVSKFHLPRPQAITLGLLIAAVKASLVGAVFMHLWGEKHLIHRFLYTAAFFGLLMIIPMIDFILVAPRKLDHADVAAEHPDEGGKPEKISVTVPALPAATPAKAKSGGQ